eukprot:3677745-Pyramimonas_sp.AAC.1
MAASSPRRGREEERSSLPPALWEPSKPPALAACPAAALESRRSFGPVARHERAQSFVAGSSPSSKLTSSSSVGAATVEIFNC